MFKLTERRKAEVERKIIQKEGLIVTFTELAAKTLVFIGDESFLA